jgi:hypothetical protein
MLVRLLMSTTNNTPVTRTYVIPVAAQRVSLSSRCQTPLSLFYRPGRIFSPGCRVEFSGGITVVVSAPKSQRINLRVTAGDLAVLRQAAALTGSTLTEFMVSTAVREAKSLLAETTVTSSKELS